MADLTRPQWHIFTSTALWEGGGFLTHDEIFAFLLGDGPERSDRTAQPRASAHDAPGFARWHNRGLSGQDLTETG
jgi:hypothetical protein